MAAAIANGKTATTDDEYLGRSYNTFPQDGTPITIYEFEQRGITPRDVVRIWDPESKSKLLVGSYRPGGNGHTEFSIVDYMDVVNLPQAPYNPGMVWIRPTEKVKTLQSDKQVIVQKVGRLEDKLVALQPEVVQ